MSLWERFTGKVVDASGLGQKRRAVTAGTIAFDEPLADLRLEFGIKGHPWLADSATTSLLLAVWAGRALQDMAAVLESTAERDLGDPGMLPDASYALAGWLYDAALAWIGLAQGALAAAGTQPGYQLPIRLPAQFPRFDWTPDALPAHFTATIAAAGQLATSVDDALIGVTADRSRLPQKYDGAFLAVDGSVKVARAKLDQVQAAASDRQAVRLSREIWGMLGEVVRLYFTIGQQVARPGLIDQRYDAYAATAARAQRLPPPPAPGAAPARGPGPVAQGPGPVARGPGRPPVQIDSGYAPRAMPAQPRQQPPRPAPPPPPPPPPPTLGQRLGLRFDAWDLTDSDARAMYRNDPARIAELEAFWRSDTNPDETYRLFELIAAAGKAGQVTVRPNEFAKACPWISTFVALSETAIGTERFRMGQLFTLRVGMTGSLFCREFDRLGFLPGTQPPRPAPAPGTGQELKPGQRSGPGGDRTAGSGQAPGQVPGPPRIDATRRGDRRRPAVTGGNGPSAAVPAGTGGSAGRAAVAPDIWRLTAAFQRPQRRNSPADVERIRQLWQSDPDPALTIAAHEEILTAVRAGTVRQNGDESLRDTPWSQVYVTLAPVMIGGVQLGQNEKFALQVGADGGTFRRSIIRLGTLRQTRPADS